MVHPLVRVEFSSTSALPIGYFRVIDQPLPKLQLVSPPLPPLPKDHKEGEVDPAVVKNGKESNRSRSPDSFNDIRIQISSQDKWLEAIKHLLYQIHKSKYQFNLIIIQQMTETQRYLQETLKPTYQDEFIWRRYLGCFKEYVFVVIKKRSLYVYPSKIDYEQRPYQPWYFFNLSYLTCSLGACSVKIANEFFQIELKHEEEDKLLELLQAIQNAKTLVGPRNLFPKRFLCLESSKESES